MLAAYCAPMDLVKIFLTSGFFIRAPPGPQVYTFSVKSISNMDEKLPRLILLKKAGGPQKKL
jgi:hypothetical protein